MIVFAGIASLLAQLFVFPGNAVDADWQRAAAHVVEAVEADDVVRVHPSWTEAPMPYLQTIGNQLNRLHHPLAEDIQGVERIWIISETDRLAEALARIPFDTAKAQLERFDTITVALVEVPASTQFPFALHEHLDQAIVTRGSGKKQEKCTNWDAQKREWQCAKRDRWLYVGESVRELDNDPRTCIYAHALPNQRVLRIEFPEVPLYETLRIRAGLDLRGARNARATQIDYRIYVDDKLLTSESIAKAASPWTAHDIDTTERTGESVRLAVEVQAEAVHGRFFCFNGWSF